MLDSARKTGIKRNVEGGGRKTGATGFKGKEQSGWLRLANVTPERRKETSVPLTSHDAAATIPDDPERMIVYPKSEEKREGGKKGRRRALLIQVVRAKCTALARHTRAGERNRCPRQFH